MRKQDKDTQREREREGGRRKRERERTPILWVIPQYSGAEFSLGLPQWYHAHNHLRPEPSPDAARVNLEWSQD